MIRTYQAQKEQRKERFSQKTLDGTFLNLIETGANCPPFVSNAILNTAKNVFHMEQANQQQTIKPGQMKVIGIAQDQPAGKKLSNCRKKECTVTIYSDTEDDYTMAAYGVTGLRRAKLLRVTSEAFEQGVLLSHEDLAFKILHCGLRTVARDVRYYKDQNVFLPTRGQQMDIGPGISHKILAVRGMLERKDEYQIARNIYHSLVAVERYTLSFARVAILNNRDIAPQEIAFIVQISKRLVDEYLALYKTFNTPKYKERLHEILGKAQNFDALITPCSSQNIKKKMKEKN